MRSKILDWSRTAKRLIVIAVDIVLGLIATWLAFTLRLDTPHWPAHAQWLLYVIAPVLAVPIFIKFGLYRAIFRYTGLATLATTAKAVVLYGALYLAALLMLQTQVTEGLPRTVGVLQPLIFGLLVGASRALARFWLTGVNKTVKRRLLIYGAGSAGVQTAAGIASTRQFTLLGFIDDDPLKIGRSINDVRVHAPYEVPQLVDRLGITDILLALPSATRETRNQIIGKLYALPVHIRTLPGLDDLASGRVTLRDFRELDIEDLLGRQPVQPDHELLARNSAGKVVLITGAGGSIGSELCRQVLRERPRQLLLLDHSEFGLYSVHEELEALAAKQNLDVEIVPLLGSVRQYARMSEICGTWRPDTVYHAAAYKHVPMVEHNPAEGVANNVLGTINIARAAVEYGVSCFVLISTDKAVRPTNVMGASKRVAEMILQALADCVEPDFTELDQGAGRYMNRTRFVMVRFGNVLGSSGSAVPLFRRQIELGGPVTITHPDVTRYFMTIPEATQLVVQAGAMAQGGEVFVLDMGDPVRIMELARRMITLSGFTLCNDDHPEGDIEIVITGLRPGEKLYEELLIGENPLPTAHPRIMQAREEFMDWRVLSLRLAALTSAIGRNDVGAIRTLLGELVSGARLEARVFDLAFQERQQRDLLAAADPP